MKNPKNEDARKMHKDFFDKVKEAKDNGYYLEAIFVEYAAMESRLEVMCGLLGLPCNKFLDDVKRKEIIISKRIECLKRVYNQHLLDEYPQLRMTNKLWKNLEEWLDKRNRYVHGLFKKPEKYKNRKDNSSTIAERGYEFTDLLYSEVNRLRRIKKNHSEKLTKCESECKRNCRLLKNEKELNLVLDNTKEMLDSLGGTQLKAVNAVVQAFALDKD